MSTTAELSNLSRAALAAYQAWGINDPRTKAIRARIESVRAERRGEKTGKAVFGGNGAFADFSKSLFAVSP